MKRSESPWHTLALEKVQTRSLDRPDEGWREELDRTVTHPAECDQLKYGEICWFDGAFFEELGHDELPTEPGVYRARVWIEGPDYYGEYDGGSEWEPMPETS